ncbi:hypothetical protein Psuf_083090 [Phytohabitans suffuscus]|uniref:Uncharacterized protein n=1 Tax=Phytohabitans suffuscus TaxID=624315 RepID=A0A6F8YY51_9ACTN|nr:hypothetical protein [Phytohabitans suffuscus]BCB90996.1 hypothetical protein Psuf_083090 [Phytohabitans suffuscus]
MPVPVACEVCTVGGGITVTEGLPTARCSSSRHSASRAPHGVRTWCTYSPLRVSEICSKSSWWCGDMRPGSRGPETGSPKLTMSVLVRKRRPNEPGRRGWSATGYTRRRCPPTGSGHGSSGATRGCGRAYDAALWQRSSRSVLRASNARTTVVSTRAASTLSPGGTTTTAAPVTAASSPPAWTRTSAAGSVSSTR